MATIVEISAVETTIHCDEKGNAEQRITIHNTSGRDLRLGARVRIDSPGKSEWVGSIVQSDRKKATEWELGENDTIQLTVPIKAEGAPEGQYGFRVEVYSTDDPGEEYALSNTLAFKVSGKKVEPVKEVKKPFPMWIVAVIVAVLVVIGGGVAWLMTGGEVKVPDLVGLSADKAKAALKDSNLDLGTVTEELTGKAPSGTVIGQKPKANAKVEKNSTVDLVLEVVPVSVPKLVSMSLDVAKATLEDEGLTVGTVTEQSTGRAPSGTVISQKPAAKTKVETNSAVDLVVEAVPVSVPKLISMSLDVAKATLEDEGLTVGAVTEQSTGRATAGTVISQSPAAKTKVETNSAVDLVIEAAVKAFPMVYEHNGYNGRSQTLDVGHYDMGQLSIGNDVISSLKVPPGWRVTLFQHAGFQGATRAFTADTPALPDFNDTTSGIIVERQ